MKTSNQFNSRSELYKIIENGTGHNLTTGAYKTHAEQKKILREEIIPFLKHNYKIKFPSDYTPTTFDKLFSDIASFNDKEYYQVKNHDYIETENVHYIQHNSMRIIRPHSNYEKTLFVQKNFFDDYTDLAESIEDNRNALYEILEDVTENIDVDLDRHWFGALKKESIENAITEIHENLSENLRKCGNALLKLYENQSKTLELISILAKLEEDLYNQFDDSEIATNELRQLFVEWCEEQNISDEDVQELLERSFQRSLTLRDRINSLRDNFENRIDKLEDKYEEIENTINKYVKESCNELNSTIEKHKSHIAEFIKEQHNVLKQSFNDVLTNVTQINQRIDDKKAELNTNIEQAINEIGQTRNELLNDKEKTESFYREQRLKIEEQFKDLIFKREKELSDTKSMIEEMLKKQQKDFEEAKNTISSLFMKRTLLLCSVTGVLSIIITMFFIFCK